MIPLEKIKKTSIDIVILDIKMPKISGFEVLKEIKEISPNTKVLIASGYKSVETAQEAIKLGASDYIVKPFETEKVLNTVKQL